MDNEHVPVGGMCPCDDALPAYACDFCAFGVCKVEGCGEAADPEHTHEEE